MFTRADIRRIGIAVTAKDYSRVMVSLGLVRLVHIDRAAGVKQEGEADSGPYAGIQFDKAAAERIVADAAIIAGEPYGTIDYDKVFDDPGTLFRRNSEADLHEAERIKKKSRQYPETRAHIESEIKSLEAKLQEIRVMRRNGIDLPQLRSLEYISYVYCRFMGEEIHVPADKRIFYLASGEYLLAIFPRELRDMLPWNMRGDNCINLDDVIRPGHELDDEEAETEKRITELRKRLARMDSFYHSQMPRWRERMQYLAAAYSVLLEISGAESELMFTGELAVISGWINARDTEKLRNLLCDVCGDGFYFRTGTRVESRRFREIMPVLLKNNPLFRPFELLVRMMGVPGNSEVDPTPAAALAYVLIFGVMFGDLGQGLVLALAGFVLNMYGRRRYGPGSNMSDFGSIMSWCGFSAAAFGLLYGSFFSNEHIIPALLFHPMEHMMQLLLMAIMMGTVFISSGLLLNIINNLLAGRYEDALFGARGAPGLAIYGSFIFFGLRFILGGTLPASGEILFAIALPMAIFCLRGPLEYIFFSGAHMFHNGLFEYVVETLIETMEMFSGFLANTISYIRAGAFALSHAGLSIAVFTLAGIVDPSMNGAAAITVIATGNIFIILLEGLVCGIQSMRLEYYEFFGKFFKGDGIAFTPFSLGMKQVKYGGGK